MVFRLGPAVERLAAAGAAALLLVMVSGAIPTVARASKGSGGTATFALPPSETPNDVFPFVSGNLGNNVDFLQFSPLLYRPLYWYGINGMPTINYQQSLGEPPRFSNGGKTATVTLNRKFTWSDGLPVTNRDVELWMNILTTEKSNYFGYAVGSIPDDVTSMSFPANTPYQFSLTFNKAYSHLWLLYNQLSEIVPLPHQLMDRTSASGPVGNYDTTASGVIAVYNYLNSQAQDLATYATNPLWKVVDGPWLIDSYSSTTGEASFVPNDKYTGPGKPKLAKFEELPFTSDAAEFDALRAGEVDYGYLPAEDLSQESYFTKRGYKVVKWDDFGFNGAFYNFTNPKTGPIFKQLYIRQAFQKLVNQPQIVKDVYHGLALAQYGPIPSIPVNPYSSKKVADNPYPFSVPGAKNLLSSHGWTVHPGGIDVCSKPGAGSGQCGAGIAKGAQLNFSFEVASGSPPFLAEVESMQSDWSDAGIHVTLLQHPPDEIYATAIPCVNGGPGCSWDMADGGAPGFTATYSPEYLPIGTQWFASNGGTNAGGYDSPEMDSLIDTAGTDSSPTAIQAIGVYGAENLPNLWEPNYPYQLSVISPKLHGALPQDPNLNLYPQNWTLSS
ncbi:MAG: ABC transporter substrate-binding protein [Candidatus Dormiibacterota bacterium]